MSELAWMADRAITTRQAAEDRARTRALRLVADGSIQWRSSVGVSGGFTGVGGGPLNGQVTLLLGLWTLFYDQSISVMGERVTVTDAGRRELLAVRRG